MFHPGWSNHVRYLVLPGPYNRKGPINVISGGGPQVEIYLARFSKDFRQIEAAARVSQNPARLFPGRLDRLGVHQPGAGQRAGPPPGPTASGKPRLAPGKTENLLWAFRDTRKPLTIPARDPDGGNNLPGSSRPAESARDDSSNSDSPEAPGNQTRGDTGLVEHWNTRQTLSVSMIFDPHGNPVKRAPAPCWQSSPKPSPSLPKHRRGWPWSSIIDQRKRLPTPLATGPDPATGSEILATLKPDRATHLVITLGKLGVSVRQDGQPARETPP
ncbi:MAG: hypothetical protein CM1200mP2_20000 [Planctomycetaceae bacterium]|nr:MAG: hypothetical protein CM1200mP2_20000 [Planctomycetaceae bacterium]